jgi:hypothetical protein
MYAAAKRAMNGVGVADMRPVWNTVPVVRAEGYLGRGGRGGSRPILLRLEGGTVAHVKLQYNPQSTRSLCSDWIGTLLGLAVGAPFSEVLLVRIPFEDIARIPQLTRIRWRPGLQFGTRFVPKARPASLRIPWQRVTNWQELPLVALLETWMHNRDLKFSHLLLYPTGEGRLKFLATDHGFIFPGGPGWSVEDLWEERDSFPPVGPITQVAMAAPMRFAFGPALAAIAELTSQHLWELVASTPAEWGLSPRRRRAVVDFLHHRQQHLPRVAKRLEALWNHGKPPGEEGAQA